MKYISIRFLTKGKMDERLRVWEDGRMAGDENLAQTVDEQTEGLTGSELFERLDSSYNSGYTSTSVGEDSE